MKLREGKDFTPVCDSVHGEGWIPVCNGQGGLCIPACKGVGVPASRFKGGRQPGQTPPEQTSQPEMTMEAGGKHSTGMHSCQRGGRHPCPLDLLLYCIVKQYFVALETECLHLNSCPFPPGCHNKMWSSQTTWGKNSPEWLRLSYLLWGQRGNTRARYRHWEFDS